MTKFKLVIFFLGWVFTSNLRAQIIVGQVKDQIGHNPIPFATLHLANSRRVVAISDEHGYYKIWKPSIN